MKFNLGKGLKFDARFFIRVSGRAIEGENGSKEWLNRSRKETSPKALTVKQSVGYISHLQTPAKIKFHFH